MASSGAAWLGLTTRRQSRICARTTERSGEIRTVTFPGMERARSSCSPNPHSTSPASGILACTAGQARASTSTPFLGTNRPTKRAVGGPAGIGEGENDERSMPDGWTRIRSRSNPARSAYPTRKSLGTTTADTTSWDRR